MTQKYSGPKRLSEVRLNAPVWINPAALKERPDLAAHIAHVINTWAYADVQLTGLLTTFLKSEYRVVHQMLDALYSSEARRAALIAAAHSVLAKDDVELFDGVCKFIAPSRNTRNDFVHNLWATSTALPDALLLMDASAYTGHDIQFAEFLERISKPGPKSVPVPRIEDSAFLVYERSDLIAEVAAAEKAMGMIVLLESAFAEPSPARDHARLALSTDLAASLSPKHTSRRNTPAVRQRPPTR